MEYSKRTKINFQFSCKICKTLINTTLNPVPGVSSCITHCRSCGQRYNVDMHDCSAFFVRRLRGLGEQVEENQNAWEFLPLSQEVPVFTTMAQKVEKLKLKLQTAERQERYEDCAVLRDLIKDLT